MKIATLFEYYALIDISVIFVKDDRDAILQLVFQIGERKIDAKKIK